MNSGEGDKLFTARIMAGSKQLNVEVPGKASFSSDTDHN